MLYHTGTVSKVLMIDRFDFLKETLNLLIVDAYSATSPVSLEQLFRPFGCCRIHRAATNADALVLLRSGIRFHACCIELGMHDVDQDEFVLLRLYAHHSSIMVITSRNSAAKGAESILLGARAVFDRNESLDKKEVARVLAHQLLVNIVNHRYTSTATDSYSHATRLLFEKNPQSVTEWAEHMHLSDRQLRNLWHAGSGFGAKHMLFLYTCYRDAFHYYMACSIDKQDESAASALFFKKQYQNYFESHRELLSYLLN